MAERAMRYLGSESGATLTPVPLDDAAGLVATRDGVVFAVIRLAAADGAVKHRPSIIRLPGCRPAPARFRRIQEIATIHPAPQRARMSLLRRPPDTCHPSSHAELHRWLVAATPPDNT